MKSLFGARQTSAQVVLALAYDLYVLSLRFWRDTIKM